jgi:peptidylprolyl isomerase
VGLLDFELEDNVFKFGTITLTAVLLMGMILTGCGSASGAATAKDGDVVQVDYTGKLADGTVFDSSIGRTPLEFTLGKGQVVPGFEKAVLGMKVGEKKTVTIPSDDAYGPHLDSLVVQVSRDRIKIDGQLAVGQVLQTSGPNGQQIQFTVINISDNGTVTLDANSPLAGKDLTFDIELVAIK